MVSHRPFSDSKSSQVSRTLLSILAYINNALFFTNTSEIIPSAPITTGMTVTFVFHNFWVLLQGLDIYLSFCFLFIYSVVCRDGKAHYLAGSLFCCGCCLSLSLVVKLRFSNAFLSQSPREVSESHPPRWILGCPYTTCLYGQILISCSIPSWSSFLHSCVES